MPLKKNDESEPFSFNRFFFVQMPVALALLGFYVLGCVLAMGAIMIWIQIFIWIVAGFSSDLPYFN